MTVPFSIAPDGTVSAIYDDALPLRELEAILGAFTIQRASSVEPTPDGRWTADMAPSGGPVLGPYKYRGKALAAEVRWLQTNILGTP